MTEQKLLPCPFCGSEGIVLPQGNPKKLSWAAECGEILRYEDSKCDVEPCTEDFDTKEEAVKTWNTRADNTQRYKEQDERVKSLLETLKSTNETSQIIAMRAKRYKEALEKILNRAMKSREYDPILTTCGIIAENALKNNP